MLKHRQGKNHKMRIVLFIGSPLVADEGEVVKLAKRLKKEKVNVDIVSFGDHQANNDLLTAFINALNGKDGTGSHLVSVPRGSQLQEALISSPIIQGKFSSWFLPGSFSQCPFLGEDGLGGAGLGGAGFEFGVDPNEDPELALVKRKNLVDCQHANDCLYFRPFACRWKSSASAKKKNSAARRPHLLRKRKLLEQLSLRQLLLRLPTKLCSNALSLSLQRLR